MTDQKGSPVSVCEKHKRVKYFLCITCDQKMFCITCTLNNHKAHDYIDSIEKEENLVCVKGKLHEVLENLDILYKQSAGFLESLKAAEEKFTSMVEPYKNNMVEISKEVLMDALDMTQKETSDVKDLFENQNKELCENMKQFETVLKEFGDSQSSSRDYLSASSLKFGNLISDGNIEKLVAKFSEEVKLPLVYIEPEEIDNYHAEIQQARENLRKDVIELLRTFLKSFVFTRIGKLEIDLNSSSNGFKEFPCHKGDLENAHVTSTKYRFNLAILNGGDFKLHTYTDILATKPVKPLDSISSKFFKFIPGGDYDCLYFTSESSCKKFQTNFLIKCRADQVAASFSHWISSEFCIPVIVFCRFSNGDWITDYETSSTHANTKSLDFHLKIVPCATKLYPEQPYGFAISNDIDGQDMTPKIACISKNSLFLYSVYRNQEIDFGQRPIYCNRMNSSEHKGSFGCGFFSRWLFGKKFISLAIWCLECQIVEVIKIPIEEENDLPKRPLNQGDTEKMFQFNFISAIQSITTFKRGLIIMTKDGKLYTCENILSKEMLYLYQKKN